MGRLGAVAMSMASGIPPLAVIAVITLPAPMFAAFALPQYAAHEIWAFLTSFGTVAAPVGVGLAIAAHVLGKKLGTLVGRIDKIVNSREDLIAHYELPSLSSLLNDATNSFYQMNAALGAQDTVTPDATLRALSHLHAIRNAIISTRLARLGKTVPLEEIDHVIRAFTFCSIDRARLLELRAALQAIHAVVLARIEAPGAGGAPRAPRTP